MKKIVQKNFSDSLWLKARYLWYKTFPKRINIQKKIKDA